ncbi:MAG: hypothetical protein ACK5KM_14810 [Hyphomicrobiaceae bacterium]
MSGSSASLFPRLLSNPDPRQQPSADHPRHDVRVKSPHHSKAKRVGANRKPLKPFGKPDFRNQMDKLSIKA